MHFRWIKRCCSFLAWSGMLWLWTGYRCCMSDKQLQIALCDFLCDSSIHLLVCTPTASCYNRMLAGKSNYIGPHNDYFLLKGPARPVEKKHLITLDHQVTFCLRNLKLLSQNIIIPEFFCSSFVTSDCYLLHLFWSYLSFLSPNQIQNKKKRFDVRKRKKNKRNKTQKVRGVNTGRKWQWKKFYCFSVHCDMIRHQINYRGRKKTGSDVFIRPWNIVCVTEFHILRILFFWMWRFTGGDALSLLLPHQWRIKKKISIPCE